MPTQNTDSPDLNESANTTEGPGQGRMKPRSIAVVAGYLVVISALVLYGLIKLWPYPTPSGENPKSENQDVASRDLSSSVPCPAPTPTPTTTPSPNSPAPNAQATGSVPEQNRTTNPTQPATSQIPNGPVVGSTSNTNQTARGTTQPTNSTSGQPGSSSNQPATTNANQTNTAQGAANSGSGASTSAESTSTKTPPQQNQAENRKLPDPECISFFGTSAVPVYLETRLLLLVMLSGALGSLMHALRSLYWYTGNRLMVWSWVAFYLLLPLTGAMLAVIFYFVIRGGFFSPQARFDTTSPFGFAALSALVGLFSPQATLKLKEIAETIFSKPAAGTDNKPQESASQAPPTAKPAPTIASITPSSDESTKLGAASGSGIDELDGHDEIKSNTTDEALPITEGGVG